MAPGQQSSRQLRDELREQRARLLARAALLKTDVGALLAPAVDAVPPAARPRLRDLNKRGHARLAVLEAQELRERRRRARLLGLEDLQELGLAFGVASLLLGLFAARRASRRPLAHAGFPALLPRPE